MQVEVRFPNVPSGTLQLRMARTSPGRYALHEFAKNVFDVSIVERQGPAAHRDAARSASMGLRQSRRHRRHHLQDLRRSHRRHLSRHRRRARAHQHSRGADVRARLVRAAGARDVRAAARQEVEGGDAVVSDERSAGLHRAEHPLPDGQPDRLQQLHAADVHGGRWQEAEWTAADHSASR